LATTTITAVSVLTDTTSLAPAGTIVSPSTANAYTISGSAAYGEQTLPQLNASTLNAIITSPPGMLSQTGLFSSLSPLTPAAGILPYNVISPLWSDGANKDRFIALPAGRKIVYDPVNEFTFPADTVMIKNFVLTIDGVPTPLELRLIMLTGPNTGYGVTYKWNTGATDAILMGPGSPTMLQDGLDENEGSPTVQQVWHYPSRAECLQCHTNNAGFVLGAKARQLNTAFTYPSTMVTDNELRTWNYLQLFSTNIGENYMSLITLNNIGDPPPATVASIARSFLDSNCAQCHRLGGVTTLWDARFITPLAGQNIVNGPLLNTFGVLGAEVVYPQVVGASMIYLRMNTVNTTPPLPTLMPPLARHVIDTNAVTAMAAWINSLTPNQPVISSIAPSSGPVGTTVIIGGSAFSGTTMVTFNGTQATSFTVIADTSLSVTVPNGATTGPIVVTSCGLTATSATYAVIPTPIISSFTPANGPVGTVVTITGSGLSGATAVSFGATAASSFAVNSGTSITATIANSTAVGAATISVTTPGGVAFSASPFTVYPPPVISSFTPANGPVGTVVTITGSGLSGATAVTFGATAASSFTVNSATSITATIANGTAVGAAAIRINTSGGVASSNSPFMVFPPPSVTSIEPGSGVVGEMVTITGTGLSGTTAVAFNGTSAVTFLVNSDTQIDATVPAGATTGTVAVTTPGGTATSSTFTVEAATSASGQSPPASPPLTSGGSCGNGGSVLIGVLLLTAILRRLRLSDRP
jgi:hypothetical protein